MGDLNKQHDIWRSTYNNRNGKKIQKAIVEENVVVLNDSRTLRITSPPTRSCPDLARVSIDQTEGVDRM